MKYPKLTWAYAILVYALGAASIAVSVWLIEPDLIDVHLVLLFLFTIGVGSRITIQVPRFKGYISASEIFIFLALLLYGGQFAVLLAAGDAFATSWRICKKRSTVFFNTATMAISTAVVWFVLQVLGLYTVSQVHGTSDYQKNFVVALSVIAITQFITNTALASSYGSLRDNTPFWDTWKVKYIWSFFTYLIGAIGAGLLVQLGEYLGLNIIVATFPICFFVFLGYRMYMRNVEASMRQAEQAEQYARILETQSEALRESEERFRSAFDYAPIGIGLLTSTGKWLKVNHALTQILGYGEEDFLMMDFQSITVPEDLGMALIKVHELLSGKIDNCQMEQRYFHKTGRIVWASWSVSAASDVRSKQPNLIFQIQDITQKKNDQQKLEYEATHDQLTGLPNRSYFLTRLTTALEKVHSIQGYQVSVLFIDLDRFKVVNDSLGHLIGDLLLKGIAERLNECMRPADIVARLGGDEFTILVEGVFDAAEVTRIADRIQHQLTVPFDLNGHIVYTSASIGVLHASEKHFTAEDMMRDADTAMYQAKRAGKARHAVFDEEMHKAARETLQLETDLRRAVEHDELAVRYQPILDLESGRITGVEALARWYHPTLGHISPGKFIPLAEEIGLIDQLCAQVLHRSCTEIRSLQDRRSKDRQLTMSVNLSSRQFAQGSLVQSICSILDETGFAPRDLHVEITESVFFEHADSSVAMLNHLRGLGIDIHIDDFGTGYSNLSYLMRLPISTLKIDRSFISIVDDDGSNDAVVEAIIALARKLSLRVIAEGVETQGQLERLKELGCEGAQGYYFASPMEFTELKKFLGKAAIRDSNLPMADVPVIEAIQ